MIAGKPVVNFTDIVNETDADTQSLMIDTFLEQLEVRGNEVIDDVHNFACYAIENAIKNSNSFNLMTQLVLRVGNMRGGVRAVRLREWFIENAPVSWEKTKQGARFVTDKSRDETAYRLDYAIEHPFYEKEEVASKPYSLENLQKAIETAIKRSNSDKANPEEQAILRELAGSLETTFAPKLAEAVATVKANAANTDAETAGEEQPIAVEAAA